VEHALADVAADLPRRFVARRQRVEVGDQEEALVLPAVLQLEVFLEGADVVAEVELARRPQARQQPLAAGDGAVLALLGHLGGVSIREMQQASCPTEGREAWSRGATLGSPPCSMG